MGAPYSDLEVASFMTCSKGYMGECGIRGGYAEVINMDPGVFAMLQKSISAKLCPTVIGQACMDVVVNPPVEGEPSFGSFDKEVKDTLASYAERAKMVADTLNSIPVRNIILIFKMFLTESCIRESAATLSRAPCTHFLRSSSQRRPSQPPRRPVNLLMYSTHFTCWRPPASASSLGQASVNNQEHTTSGEHCHEDSLSSSSSHLAGRPSCLRRR